LTIAVESFETFDNWLQPSQTRHTVNAWPVTASLPIDGLEVPLLRPAWTVRYSFDAQERIPPVPEACNGWCGSHVLIGHIAIAMLGIAPLLVLMGMGLFPGRRRLFLGAALAVMMAGTLTAFAAVETGHAALKSLSAVPSVQAAAEKHRVLAETATELFAILTLGFGALLFVPMLLGRPLDLRTHTALLAVYLVFYASGAILLVHTALHGDRLTHALTTQTATAYQLPGKE
jgi:hypothetical protein